MRTILLLLAIALGIINRASVAEAQVAKLRPVDEARRDPSFLAFRSRLLRAVRDRDTTFVLGILAPDILNSFGGNGGIEEFRDGWELARADPRLWDVLGDVLAHGGTFQGDSVFRAPYSFGAYPGEHDAFEHWVVIARAVRVRRDPTTVSPVIGILSYDVVRAVSGHAPGDSAWTTVELADGRRGFVASRFLRSPIGYRAIFRKRAGRWFMTALVAGD